jgi:hypothetical protein
MLQNGRKWGKNGNEMGFPLEYEREKELIEKACSRNSWYPSGRDGRVMDD